MNKLQIAFFHDMIKTLKQFKSEKEKEGYVVTVELLIKSLEDYLEKQNNE